MLRGRFEGLKARIDAAVDRAVAEQRIVGTVLLIGHEGETTSIRWHRNRAVRASPAPRSTS